MSTHTFVFFVLALVVAIAVADISVHCLYDNVRHCSGFLFTNYFRLLVIGNFIQRNRLLTINAIWTTEYFYGVTRHRLHCSREPSKKNSMSALKPPTRPSCSIPRVKLRPRAHGPWFMIKVLKLSLPTKRCVLDNILIASFLPLTSLKRTRAANTSPPSAARLKRAGITMPMVTPTMAATMVSSKMPARMTREPPWLSTMC